MVINGSENIWSPHKIGPQKTWYKVSFSRRESNEAAVIAAKDKEVFLLLIHALDQLECFLFSRTSMVYEDSNHLIIGSNHLINIKMIYDNLESEVSDIVPGLDVITGNDNSSNKINV